MIDFLTIHQAHPAGCPVLNDGHVLSVDSDGSIDYKTDKYLSIEGSYTSKIRIRSDGSNVSMSGNIGKFNRQDNLFNYDFPSTIKIANQICAKFGLPPFTNGERFYIQNTEKTKSSWTGAHITRIDVTENFFTGSLSNARAFLAFAATQQASRLKTGTYGDGETVDYGRGSRRVYSKLYLKSKEIIDNLNKLRKYTEEHKKHLETISKFCEDNGIVRFETTYKSTQLQTLNCYFLGEFNMNVIQADFNKRKSTFFKNELTVEDLKFSNNSKLLSVYRMWLAGDDLMSLFARRTFYRHRASLLNYGIDISIKPNITKLEQPTKIIQLQKPFIPDFYNLPKVNHLNVA